MTDEPTERFDSAPVVDAVPPAAMDRQGLSGAVTAAGVILLVIGSLVAVLSYIGFLSWALIGEMMNLADQTGLTQGQQAAGHAAGRTFFIVSSAGLAVAIAHLLAGVGILRRRGWARILGVVLGTLGAGGWGLVLLSAIFGAFQSFPAVSTTLTPAEIRATVRVGLIFVQAFAAVGLVASIFVAEVLGRRRAAFA